MDFSYVGRELRRIAVFIVSMLATIEIVLSFVLHASSRDGQSLRQSLSQPSHSQRRRLPVSLRRRFATFRTICEDNSAGCDALQRRSSVFDLSPD